MKIIDEKGKLFGLINIIDLGVIILLIGLMPMVYFGYKILRGEDATIKEYATVKVEFQALSMQVVNVMKEGDIQKDSSGAVIAKLTKIYKIEPADMVIFENNIPIKVDGSKRKDILAELYIKCTNAIESVYYNDNPLKIGKEIVFSPHLYEAKGAVLDIQIEDTKK